MSNIETNLAKIKSAVYGEDVRDAIHDAIHDCYEDGKAGEVDLIARAQSTSAVSTANNAVSTANNANSRVDNLIIQSGTSDAEIIDARQDEMNYVYNALRNRINIEFESLKKSFFALSNGVFFKFNYVLNDGQYARKTDGLTGNSNNWKKTKGFIYLDNAEYILFSCPINSNATTFEVVSAINFYSANSDFASWISEETISIDNTKNGKYVTKMIKVPLNAKFFIASVPANYETEYFIYGIRTLKKRTSDYQIQKYNVYNLLDMFRIEDGNSNGLSWVVNEDGSVTFSGTPTNTVIVGLADNKTVPDYVETDCGYYIYISPLMENLRFQLGYYKNGAWTLLQTTKSDFFYIPDNISGFSIGYRASKDVYVNETVKVDVIKDKLADTVKRKTFLQIYNANAYNILEHVVLDNSPIVINGITWTPKEDGSLDVSGTATGSSFFVYYNNCNSFPEWILKNKKYYVYLLSNAKENEVAVYFSYVVGNETISLTGSDTIFIPEEATGLILQIRIAPNVTINDNIHLIISTEKTNRKLMEMINSKAINPRILDYPRFTCNVQNCAENSFIDTLTIVSYNNEMFKKIGLDNERIINYRKWLIHSNADILLMQECYEYIDFPDNTKRSKNVLFDFLYLYKYGNNSDCTIFTKNLPATSNGVIHFSYLDGTGYDGSTPTTTKNIFQYVFCNKVNKRLLLISTHLRPSGIHNPFTENATRGPLDDRAHQLIELFEWVRSCKDQWDYCIIGGDMNTTNSNGYDDNNFNIISENKDDYLNIINISAYYNFTPINGSYLGWFVTVPGFGKARGSECLDNILVSNNIFIDDIVCDETLYDSLSSDHLPIICRLRLTNSDAEMPNEPYNT